MLISFLTPISYILRFPSSGESSRSFRLSFPRIVRERWQRWFGDFFLIIGLLMLIGIWQTRDLPAGPAPPLTGLRLDGVVVSAGSGHALIPNRPALIVFWASWCPVCRFEEESLAAIARDWPVLIIAMQSGNEDELRRYLAMRGLALPMIADADGRLARQWSVTATPTHFVLDSHGNIRFRSVGYSPAWSLRARLFWVGKFPAQ